MAASRQGILTRPWNRPGAESPLPFRQKILYYGLMLFLTLLALEGMARLAYYAAYGSGYGGDRSDLPGYYPPPYQLPAAKATLLRIRHPFYGYTWNWPNHDLSAMPPRQRQEDTVVIGLLGGSVAQEVQPFLQRALNRWFAVNNGPRQPIVLDLTAGALKQPQQTMIVANTLLLGGEFDLMVNLDGFNEMADSAGQNPRNGLFPFFPVQWHQRLGLTTAAALRAQIGILRRKQARLAQTAATSPLRRSAIFGLANRWRQERNAAEIIRRNHELAATRSGYSLEKHGSRNWPDRAALLPTAARNWYRSSVTLARLAELSGAEYYHFLQPNQYAPGTKPLSPEERAVAYRPDGRYGPFIAPGYPRLRQFGRDLPSQGVNYFDLTGIFADRRETLYRDDCCHLTARGYELLAAEMVRRLEPALRRRAARPAGEPVSALAAARRPARPDTLLLDAAFQVYLQRDGRWLRYSRADCAAAEVEPRFFLHLTPRDLTDLPPHRREHGFDNRDFSFAAAGGFLWRGQCQAQIRLPDYPIAALRTGQYAADAGELWVAEYTFPE